ncbi:MAG TPA: transporter [Pirellulales bacterium]|nr:transporter [Pirellulales bacterium]
MWRPVAALFIAASCWGLAPARSCLAQGPICEWLTSHDQRSAENDSFLQTDGPSFTRANSTVPQNMLQLETRYLYQNGPTLNSFPQFDLRYGLTQRLEMRAEWAGVDTGPGIRSAEDLEVGFKYLTSKQRRWVPQAALMVELFVPSGYGPNAINTVTPEIDYIYGWTLTPAWAVGGSTGAIFGQPGDSRVTQYYQSAVVEWNSPEQHVQIFGEAFSLFGSHASQGAVLPSLDSGLLWRPTHNLQLDWRVGMGLNHETTAFFTGGGVTIRY